MVRATIILSAVFALATSVSAGLISVKADKYIGTAPIHAENAAQHLVDGRGVVVKDIAQRINVASPGPGKTVLGSLLKREEAPAGTIRIARAAGSKKNKDKNAQTA